MRPSLLDFLKDRFGGKWVVTRRTPRMIARYGDDTTFVSPGRMVLARRDYRTLYGDPDDPVRAELYLALLECAQTIRDCGAVDWARHPLSTRVSDALEAETRICR